MLGDVRLSQMRVTKPEHLAERRRADVHERGDRRWRVVAIRYRRARELVQRLCEAERLERERIRDVDVAADVDDVDVGSAPVQVH